MRKIIKIDVGSLNQFEVVNLLASLGYVKGQTKFEYYLERWLDGLACFMIFVSSGVLFCLLSHLFRIL